MESVFYQLSSIIFRGEAGVIVCTSCEGGEGDLGRDRSLKISPSHVSKNMERKDGRLLVSIVAT